MLATWGSDLAVWLCLSRERRTCVARGLPVYRSPVRPRFVDPQMPLTLVWRGVGLLGAHAKSQLPAQRSTMRRGNPGDWPDGSPNIFCNFDYVNRALFGRPVPVVRSISSWHLFFMSFCDSALRIRHLLSGLVVWIEHVGLRRRHGRQGRTQGANFAASPRQWPTRPASSPPRRRLSMTFRQLGEWIGSWLLGWWPSLYS